MMIDIDKKQHEIKEGDLILIRSEDYRLVVKNYEGRYALVDLSTGELTCVANDIDTLIKHNKAVLVAKKENLKLSMINK